MTEANEQGQPLGLASTAELSLVERLRQRQMVNWVDRPDPLCQEAAAELERQRRMLDAVRGMARGALKTNSRDRSDWVADMAMLAEEVDRFLKA